MQNYIEALLSQQQQQQQQQLPQVTYEKKFHTLWSDFSSLPSSFLQWIADQLRLLLQIVLTHKCVLVIAKTKTCAYGENLHPHPPQAQCILRLHLATETGVKREEREANKWGRGRWRRNQLAPLETLNSLL